MKNFIDKLSDVYYSIRRFLYYSKEFFIYDLPYFFKNLWNFRKELWRYRAYDYSGSLGLLRRGIEQTSILMNKNQRFVNTDKMVNKMNRFTYILKIFEDGLFEEEAEKELGIKYLFSGLNEPESLEQREINRKIMKKSTELEKSLLKELGDLLIGQDITKFPSKEYDEHFDGSGIQNWWD